METIVVGTDGSEHARAALEFAAAEAELRGARLRVVSAWEVPLAAYGGGFATINESAFAEFRQTAESIVEEAIAAVGQSHPGVHCDGVVLEGQPAEVLLQHAGDAALVVVGSRGLGGFRSLLLGSVGQQVVHHAPCPVVVVR